MYFSKEPEITFSNVFCPVCGERTGPQTICFNEKVKPQTIKTPNGISLNVRSPSCNFRQAKTIRAETNYPVSQSLIEHIVSNTDGINNISATEPYCFVFSPSNNVHEEMVKAAITLAFKGFIKKMNSLESDITDDSKIKFSVQFKDKIKKYEIPKSLMSEIDSLKDIFPEAKVMIEHE